MRSYRKIWKSVAAVGSASALIMGATGASEAAASTKSVTLTLVSVGTTAGLSNVLATFHRAHPDISVNVTPIPSNTIQEVVPAELSAGKGPDIMFVWPGFGESMSVGQLSEHGRRLAALPSSIADSMPSQLRALNQYGGTTYGVTTTNNIQTVAYNKADFASAHLSPPQTFNQVLTDCATLRQHNEYFMALGNNTLYVNTLIPGNLQADVIYKDDPKYLTDALSKSASYWTGSHALYRGANKIAYDDYASMISHQCIYPGSLGITQAEATSLVVAGRAASELTVNWTGMESGKFGAFNLPALNGTPKTPLITDPGFAVGINAKSPYMQQDLQVVKYLTTPAAEGALASASVGFPIVNVPGFKPAPVFKSIFKQYQEGDSIPVPVNFEPNYQIKLTQEAWGEKLIDGSATADQAAAATLAPFAS